MAEEGISLPPDQDDLSDLLEGGRESLTDLLGFSEEFKKVWEEAGGSCHALAEKLLDSHSGDNSEFVAGKLCYTQEQKKFYCETLDAGPMVSHG